MEYNNWRTVPYIDTINKLNSILLSNNIALCYDEWFWNKDIASYQCKVYDCTKAIHSCGKGTSFAACQASGLAEFMERLQGLFIYPRTSSTPFFKDEKHLEGNINQMPWLNLINGEVKNLPYEWDCYLSNGFAAGNTISEAIAHSIAEIVERDTLFKYVNDDVKFRNTIQLHGELLKRALNIEKYLDGQITFFDITYYNIPTVLMMVEPFDAPDMILFYLQSSLSIELAIERCITESFQLSSYFERMFNVIVDMPLTEEVRKGFAWVKMTAGVKNAFFPKIWADQLQELKLTLPKKKLEDYIPFKNEEEFIQTFLKDYKNEFKSVYIRDFSWLGFPTVQLITEEKNINNYDLGDKNLIQILSTYYTEGIARYMTNYNRSIVADFYENFAIPFKFYDNDNRQFNFNFDNNIPSKNRFNIQSWERDYGDRSLETVFKDYVGKFEMNIDYFKQFCLK